MRYFLMLIGVAALIAFDLWILKQAGEAPPVPAPSTPWGGLIAASGGVVAVRSGGAVVGSSEATGRLGLATGVLPAKAAAPAPVAERADRKAVVQLPDAIAGEYIFGFHDRNDIEAFERAARPLGWEVAGRLDFANAVRVRRSGGGSSLEELLSAIPTPVEQSPNFYVRNPAPPPTDREDLSGRPGFGRAVLEWLGVPADNREWGSGVMVAILDTPVGPHPALEETIINRLGEPGGGADDRTFLHGTAVACLIAASGRGIRGVAPSATILSVPVLDESGRGDAFTLAEGIIRAVQAGARVVNMSVGTHGDTWLLRRAVEYAVRNGVALVAAAGNDGEERLLYPAAYAGVMAVGAADAAGRRLPFSNRGQGLSMVAPGWRVLTAGSQGELAEMSGTSASCALTSGAIAALLSRNPSMDASEAAAILERYCDDTCRMGPDEETGCGTINIGRAMNRDLAGVYDAAVCVPYLWPRRAPEDDVVVTLYAQNRGTEVIPHLLMKIMIGAREESLDYYDVKVGASVGRDFHIAVSEARRPDGVPIVVEAVIDGQSDVQPSDNVLRTAVRLRPE